MYMPSFYKQHLGSCFTNLGDDPVEILKNMGGDHNWSPEMIGGLSEIRDCPLRGMGAELFFVAKAYELFSTLIGMGDVRAPRNAADYERILAVVRHLDGSYQRSPAQQELVRLSSMSATKLKSLFKLFTGKTITGYILDKKLDRAAHLLAEKDLSVEEIAGMVGFETATGFATSFKRQVGLSPTAYRKRMVFNCVKDPSRSGELRFD